MFNFTVSIFYIVLIWLFTEIVSTKNVKANRIQTRMNLLLHIYWASHIACNLILKLEFFFFFFFLQRKCLDLSSLILYKDPILPFPVQYLIFKYNATTHPTRLKIPLFNGAQCPQQQLGGIWTQSHPGPVQGFKMSKCTWKCSTKIKTQCGIVQRLFTML